MRVLQAPSIKGFFYQKYIPNMIYKDSPYIIDIKYNDKIIKYNVLTNEKIELNNSDNISEEYLVRNWWKIDKYIDPYSIVKLIRHRTVCKFNKILPLSKFVILTTTKCNARCFYCYEHGRKLNDMTKDTANKVADFIEKHAVNDKIELSWFGGEPLYNKDIIDTITDRLYNSNKDYISTMVSNGYLFKDIDDYTLKFKWRLKSVQITIDGDSKEYKSIKNYIYNDNDPFSTLYLNIEKLLKIGINVNVRFNVSPYNENSIIAAYDKLKSLRDYGRITFYANELYGGPENFTDEEINTMFLSLDRIRDYIMSYGNFANIKDLEANGYCMKDTHRSFVINPNGYISCCEHYIDDEDAIGDIFNGINYEKLIETESWEEPLEECLTCPLAPICRRIPCPAIGPCNSYKRMGAIKEQVHNIIENFEDEEEVEINDCS